MTKPKKDLHPAPMKVTITDADGVIFFQRLAHDVKLELPPNSCLLGRPSLEETEEWWRNPYGGPGNQYDGWFGVWIKTINKEEDVELETVSS